MGGPDAGDHGRAYAPQRLIDRRDALGLTPEQVGRLEALAQEAAQARDAAASARETRRAQLDELWKADQPDAQALAGHMRAVMASQQEAQLAAVTAAARAKAVLTAEQRGRVAGWADAGRALRRAAMARPGRPRMRRDVPRRDGVQSPGMRRGLRPMR
jgi:Spy/CpxP family protein refolding chaperone